MVVLHEYQGNNTWSQLGTPIFASGGSPTIGGNQSINTTVNVTGLTITNSPQTYTGNPIAATVTCSSTGAVTNIQYNGSGTVPTAAGTYAITADCAANGNYAALTAASAGEIGRAHV